MTKRLLPLADRFNADAWPDMSCPHCISGTLSVEESHKFESASSRTARDHEAWEPEWISGFFACLLRCQRRICREIVIATGEWRVQEESTWEGPEFHDIFLLRTTLPPVPIMTLPDPCPDPVKEAVEKAAQVIWSDPGGAGSRLRLAIERVLDDQGIARSKTSTHRRIVDFRSKNASVADLLEAVKWIGNQATHEDSLTTSDVLEGAQILEHAMTLLYDSTSEAIRQRVEQINSARGLPKLDVRLR